MTLVEYGIKHAPAICNFYFWWEAKYRNAIVDKKGDYIRGDDGAILLFDTKWDAEMEAIDRETIKPYVVDISGTRLLKEGVR
jgi:hypothetical protein